jgi:hypothetical protein
LARSKSHVWSALWWGGVDHKRPGLLGDSITHIGYVYQATQSVV